jgi:hypothetical protein
VDEKQAAAVLREMEKDISRAMDAIGERGGWMTGETEYYRPCLVPLQRGAYALDMLAWLFEPEGEYGARFRSLHSDWGCGPTPPKGSFRAYCEAKFEEHRKGPRK